MKKLFTLMVCATVALASHAQVYQFSDPGFEGTWASSEEPGNGWNSFSSANASSLGFLGGTAINQSPKPSEVSGYNSSSAVKIFSKDILGKKANGNLTTGRINMGSMTPSDASNYNYSNTENASQSLLFAGRPDAFYFYAKFVSGGSPNGRANFILHDDYQYRDPEVATDASHRVGKSSVLIPATSDWTRFEGAFTYDAETPSTQYLLATFTTNPTAGGSAGDELYIDDIYFIYYSTLASLEYQGATIDFSEDKLSYDLSATLYDSNKLSYRAKGAGATAEHSYNADTQLLTITVKGNDYAVNSSNVKVYTVQFGEDSAPVEPGTGVEPGEVDYTPYYTEQKTRTNRILDSVTLTSAEYANEASNVLTIDNSPAMSYSDYTETVTMKAAPGETVSVVLQSSGDDNGWMNAFVYIDTDADGFTAGIESGSNWQPTGDLVSYSFYNNGSSSDETGWNSAGGVITGDSRSTLDLPSFTVPEEPGVYRVRVKYDWCNIDPKGGSGTYFNGTFMSHGGQIVDFMLEIPQPTGIEDVEAENAVQGIFDLSGRAIDEITAPGIYIVNGKKVLVK